MVLRRERVYQAILEDIVAGRLSPGDRVSERGLAERLGLSTTPVKEALRRLENEGFVTAVPRQGVLVRDTAITSIGDVVLVRAALEGLAARLVAARVADGTLPEQDATTLAAAVDDMRRGATATLDDVVAVNSRFHDLIRTLSGNRLLVQFMGVLLGVDAAMRRHLLVDVDEMRRGLDEHVAVYEAIIAGDVELSEERMRDHILRSARQAFSAVSR